jgi:hypothetical protein
LERINMIKPFERNVSSRRGAPMGRYPEPLPPKSSVHVEKVKLYDGCYDKGGSYWGGPDNLFCAYTDASEALFFRAQNLRVAKREMEVAGHTII